MNDINHVSISNFIFRRKEKVVRQEESQILKTIVYEWIETYEKTIAQIMLCFTGRSSIQTSLSLFILK